jgi:hypothetical protein
MGWWWLMLLAAEPVPAIAIDSSSVEQAEPVEAPIAEVTVFSDRARVRRRANPSLPPGPRALRLPDLPGAVLLDTLRVSSPARILRVEARRVERSRVSIAQVETLLDQVEALREDLFRLRLDREAIQRELDLLRRAAPVQAAPESVRLGKPAPPLKPESWRIGIDFLDQQKAKDRAQLRTLSESERVLAEKLAAVERQVAAANVGGFSAQRTEAVVALDIEQAGKTEIELEYFVSGASWRPAYEIEYRADKGALALRTGAKVRQASGEDWDSVRLELSTAIPGQGIDLPELLTWTLGEQQDFVPQAVAARSPLVPPRYAPPAASAGAELGRLAARIGELSQQIADLKNSLALAMNTPAEAKPAEQPPAAPRKKTTINFDEDRIDGNLVRPDASYATRRPAPPAAPPPPPANTPMAAPVYEAEVAMSSPSVPSRVAGSIGRAVGSLFSGSPEETVQTPLGLFEPTPDRLAELAADPDLPARLAGGLDYVYTAPARTRVPSDGQELRVPLTVEEAPAALFYATTPALAPAAFLRARLENKSATPILRGAANIYLGRDFAGEAMIETTGPGSVIELPLGADQDIKVLRKVVPATETVGLLSKDDVTVYRVTIEIGNYKKRAIAINVLDQVPKSGQEKIEVKLTAAEPRAEGPDTDGLLRWKLDLPAGKTRTITFAYEIRRPSGWKLHQR